MKIETIAEVGVWWVQRPASPRVSPRVAWATACIILPPLAATLVWVHRSGEPLWPWSTLTPITASGRLYLLRYLMLLAGGLAYLLLSSAPAWLRVSRTARADIEDAERAVREGRWEQAALHLHRHALLRGDLGRPPDARTEPLDHTVGPHLTPHRRLYLYYRTDPPPIPDTPGAGFQPRVVPVSIAGGWWTGLIAALLAVGLVSELRDALVTGQWRMLLNVNFIVVAALLVVYAYLYTAGFFGRRSYFRFTPGTAELLHFKVRASRTRTETIPLRACDVCLDLTRPTAVLTFVDRAGGRPLADYHLTRDPQTIETCLRAVLSQAPIHPLPAGELAG